MLKTNSKKARANVRTYIVDHFEGANYDIGPLKTFEETAQVIKDIFEKEKYYSNEYIVSHHIPKETIFVEWCAGLPSILDTGYYCNRSAVEDLGKILEQTKLEASKYSESSAENMLSRLIYKEIYK